jgi:hypothetical protein
MVLLQPTAVCGKCHGIIEVARGEKFHVGHKQARSKGGSDHPSNLQPEHALRSMQEAPKLAWQSKLRRRMATERAAAEKWGSPPPVGSLPEDASEPWTPWTAPPTRDW